MQPSKSGDSMKCVHCDFQLNKQIRWVNHDTGIEVDETRFRIIERPEVYVY